MARRTHLGWYIGQLQNAEQQLEEALRFVGEKHQRDPEILNTAMVLAGWSRRHVQVLEDLGTDFGGKHTAPDPERLRGALFHGNRVGGLGLVRDLHDLAVLVSDVQLGWTVLRQGVAAQHEPAAEAACVEAYQDLERQLAWVKTQLKNAAPQALSIVAEPVAEVASSVPKPPNVAAVPEVIFGPLAGAAALLVVGAVGLLSGLPLLFPALGPSAYIQAENPAQPESRFYNTVVGHVIGLAAGFVAVFAASAWDAPAVLQTKQLVPERVWASVIAVGLTLLVLPLLRASHPPAAATTLLVALGSFRTVNDAVVVVVGALLLAATGELVRHWRLRKQPFQHLAHAQQTARPSPRVVPAGRP
jgi:hypothetical protein